MKILDVQRAIHDITAQLIEKYRPEKIILFGSAASNAGEINDIDFFIVKNDIPHYGADRILELYRLIKTDVPVDYIVYKPEETEKRLALGDPFVKKILIEGKLLYG